MATHFVMMGVCGCGKITVAPPLQKYLDQCPYAEGDDFHTRANRDKVGSGTPLTGEDHYPWLGNLRNWMTKQAKSGEKYSVATCSTLKHRYRDILRGTGGEVAFIRLTPPQAISLECMLSRQGHYMKAGVLGSQLEILEELGADKYRVKIDNPGPPEAVETNIVNWVETQGLI